MKTFIVSSNQNNIKLDKFINLYIDTNRAFLFMMINKKIIRINNVHPKDFNVVLNESDEVKIYLDDKYFKSNTKPLFDIVYEDDSIIIADKNINAYVYSPNDKNKSLLDLAIKYSIEKGEYIPSISDYNKPSILTRLDYNTRGLVIISKNKDAASFINNLILNNKIDKYYYALCLNNFKNDKGTYTNYLKIDSKNDIVKVYDKEVEDSKKSILEYKVIKNINKLSLVKIKLITGRLHQIRSQMAFYNNYVIGDNKYGNKSINKELDYKYQELICKELVFPIIADEKYKNLSNKRFVSKFDINIKK